MREKIVVINPGSTSTKLALFDREKVVAEETIRHGTHDLDRFEKVADQKIFRKQPILNFLQKHHVSLEDISAVVGRGGLLRPIRGGTYLVNEEMLEDLKQERFGPHASNLGALLANELAHLVGVNAYIVDPVVVDELEDIARVSGWKEIDRRSVAHVLNQKAVARSVMEARQSSYTESNVVVAHLGGGISIGAHRRGKMIDVVNGLDGEGPFSPERTGELPLIPFAERLIEKELTIGQIKRIVAGEGGLKSYVDEIDLREIEKRIQDGDEEARFYLEAMGYQVAQSIGSMAVVLKGRVDVIILTGGAAYSSFLTDTIQAAVSWIAPVEVVPGEMEMQALYEGVKRVLSGKEAPRTY